METTSVSPLPVPVVAELVLRQPRKATRRKGAPVAGASLVAAPVAALPVRGPCNVPPKLVVVPPVPARPKGILRVSFLWKCGRNKQYARSAPGDTSHVVSTLAPGTQFQDVQRVGVANTFGPHEVYVGCWVCLRISSGLRIRVWVQVAIHKVSGSLMIASGHFLQQIGSTLYRTSRLLEFIVMVNS